MAALNAVMGSHVMECSDHSTKVIIADEIAKIIASARYEKLSKESILSELNQESRVVQMNFVALACDNLGIPPPFKNSYWERIQNPYVTGSQVTELVIEGAIKAFNKEGNSGIIWPGISASFNFKLLYVSDSEIKKEGLDLIIIEMAARLILCFNSYLSDNTQLPFLEPQDMDAITEATLASQNIETDKFLFIQYCHAVHNVVTKQLVDGIKNDQSIGRELRLKLNFDKSFRTYCFDLGLTHLLKSEINTNIIANKNVLYRDYISEEDEIAFGKDLIKLIDKVFNHTHSIILNEAKINDSFEISQEDIDAFGTNLIGCIAFYTTHAVIYQRAQNKRLPDAMLETAKDTHSETFGPDLLDLFKRYCAYKCATTLDS